jgi:hypothetical protein
MIAHEFAEMFAAEWIAAWNSHDLDRVLSHYSETFEFSSPHIVTIAPAILRTRMLLVSGMRSAADVTGG